MFMDSTGILSEHPQDNLSNGLNINKIWKTVGHFAKSHIVLGHAMSQ